jgi:ABC-2 type transport system ATP-binding protein
VASDELAAIAGVNSAERHGDAVTLVCSDSDQAIRELLARYTEARDIEITGAGLEDAFVRLTGEPDDELPATGTQVQSAR